MTAARAAQAFLLLAFVVLVASGVTGSSLDIALTQHPELLHGNQRVLLGKSRWVRSDEWLVFTPMAIGQANHEPRFPIVNRNLGPDGQNMLVVGMVGVPVSHVSALAKPATWGYFLFDLRRALAWHWWLPVFGCLFAVWGTMAVLSPGRPLLGLATSLAFGTSAYVVGWSNWPAYAVMFPAAAFWVFFEMFRTRSPLRLLALGAALGLLVAGFVLVLYPPWQVVLGYLFVVLAAAVALRDRVWEKLDAARAMTLLLAACVAGLVCGAWWMDARAAVELISATVYPGQRLSALPSTGGDVEPWQLARGFFNHHTLFKGTRLTNGSESASFIYLFPVVIAAAILRGVGKKLPSAAESALMLFCLFVLYFQYVGVSPEVARYTLWGRSSSLRAEVALGLASMLLAGVSLASRRETGLRRNEAGILSAVWTIAVLTALAYAPDGALGKPNGLMWALLVPVAFLLSYWLLLGQAQRFFALLLVVTGSMTLSFNPVTRAPSAIHATLGLPAEGQSRAPRVLEIGSQITAMGLLAAGVPIANGIFYYPQNSLWASLDPAGLNTAVTNRYQHLIYQPETSPGMPAYRLEASQPDVVTVRFDPQRFDFRLSLADVVMAPNALDLSRNRTLTLLNKGPAASLYGVTGGDGKALLAP